MTHGGNRLGAGRKTTDDYVLETSLLVRMSHAQKAAIKEAGSSAWVRSKTDEEIANKSAKTLTPSKNRR